MAHILQDLVKYFTFDEVDIDNWNFKLFHKGTALVFFMGSLVGVLTQYFGQPISCDFKGVNKDLANDYCWIHGSSYIKPEYQHHMKCITDLDGIQSEDQSPDTSYYQWVTFMMLFQAGITLFPFRIWSHLEGGLISSFGSDGRSVILLGEDEKMDEDDTREGGVFLEKTLLKHVKFFRSILHHNDLYFYQFFSCEILNYVILIFNFWITDVFLHGRFHYYGWNVLEYYWLLSRDVRENSVNPFCQAFPTEVSCTVPNIGAGGGIKTSLMKRSTWSYGSGSFCHDCLCDLLSLSGIEGPYDSGVLIHPRRRDREWQEALGFVMSKVYIGDWFVLLQLEKNVNRFFYREFMKELMTELKQRPKKGQTQQSRNISTPI
ncbi:Innexin [Caligus rogercresseyi]|uniref:Innexin n=1 Tax=Caligus rogercresseyi TaxID=217165 RepID=A0A7T8KM43_CALRO|nr:Innexin [Caligus rogercresseyi]